VPTLRFLLPFSDRLFKSDLFFSINAIKKSDKIKKIPYIPTLFFFRNESGNTTLIFLGLIRPTFFIFEFLTDFLKLFMAGGGRKQLLIFSTFLFFSDSIIWMNYFRVFLLVFLGDHVTGVSCPCCNRRHKLAPEMCSYSGKFYS